MKVLFARDRHGNTVEVSDLLIWEGPEELIVRGSGGAITGFNSGGVIAYATEADLAEPLSPGKRGHR